ncbi:MAG: single-stranded DNA-binding protein [Candidatus Gracilibacteria bacterium]
MRCVNKVILVGNLTRDPELRQTTNGQTVVTFGLATNREWMTKDGRKMTSTEFHDLAAWAKLGEICKQYLKKGKLVYVEGYLKTHSKLLPDGTKKFRTEIVVQDMIMLEKRGKDEYTETPASTLGATADEEMPMVSTEDTASGSDIFEG